MKTVPQTRQSHLFKKCYTSVLCVFLESRKTDSGIGGAYSKVRFMVLGIIYSLYHVWNKLFWSDFEIYKGDASWCDRYLTIDSFEDG